METISKKKECCSNRRGNCFTRGNMTRSDTAHENRCMDEWNRQKCYWINQRANAETREAKGRQKDLSALNVSHTNTLFDVWFHRHRRLWHVAVHTPSSVAEGRNTENFLTGCWVNQSACLFLRCRTCAIQVHHVLFRADWQRWISTEA